jgi:hypothetical protein
MENTLNIQFYEEVFEKLSQTKDLFEPLVFLDLIRLNTSKNSQSKDLDGVIRLRYAGKQISLGFLIKSRTAPKIVAGGIADLKKIIEKSVSLNFVPALIVPFLSDSIVELLKQNSLSGIDLNGNYYIVSDDFIAVRLDLKNKYRESGTIKNIYRGTSSIVGRYLLQRNAKYNSVTEIYNGIISDGGEITFSTVSKVLKSLRDDLILSRIGNEINLIQPAKLLLNLKNNYRSPVRNKILYLSLSEDRKEAKRILDGTLGRDWIWSGESSVESFASTTLTAQFSVYAINPGNIAELMKFTDTKYYNYTLYILSPDQKFIFFGSENNSASKIQTYLELSQLDKREQEIAKDIERELLSEF